MWPTSLGNIYFWIIDGTFGIAMFINACLFIPQLIKVIKNKSSSNISLTSFIGFWLIQGCSGLYGLIHGADILVWGSLLSMITCGSLILAAIYFRFKDKKIIQPIKTPLSQKISLEEIIENMPGNVFWLDRNGIFLGCNKNMLKVLNLTSTKDYIGKTYDDLYEKTHIEIIKNTDQKVMRDNKKIAIEEEAVPRGFYLTEKTPLHDTAGNVIGLLGVSLDITDRKDMEIALIKAKEEAEIANIAKAEFISNIEHDIRTPFNGIFSIAEILESDEKDPERKKMLGMMVNCSKELFKYCNNILDFGRIAEGFSTILAKKFSLEQLVTSIIGIDSLAAAEKGIELKLDYADNLPQYFIGDPERIQKILLNLLGNAIKFTNQGYIKITVKQAGISDDKKSAIIRIYVEDTGIGITPTQQEFIYESFAKVLPSNRNQHRGSSGLGLTMVKLLIEELNGEIEVKSAIDKGTVFLCTIPLKLPLVDDAPM